MIIIFNYRECIISAYNIFAVLNTIFILLHLFKQEIKLLKPKYIFINSKYYFFYIII